MIGINEATGMMGSDIVESEAIFSPEDYVARVESFLADEVASNPEYDYELFKDRINKDDNVMYVPVMVTKKTDGSVIEEKAVCCSLFDGKLNAYWVTSDTAKKSIPDGAIL